jgi:hypothetical protein
MKRLAAALPVSIALVSCGGGDGTAVTSPPGSPTTITAASGTIAQGSSVTIAGSSFGSKSHPGPAIYDDFDDATGDIATPGGGREPMIHQGVFAGYSEWEYSAGGSGAPNIVRDSVSPKTRSTYHARSVFSSDSYFRLSVAVSGDSFSTGDERYISFYYRFRKTSADYARQTKAMIVFAEGSITDAAYWSTAFESCELGGWRQHITATGSEQRSSVSGPALDGEWVRFEMYLRQSAPNTTNGAWYHTTYRPSLGIPAKETLLWDNRIMRSDSADWEYWEIGGAYWDMCGSADTGTVDIDEFYMDSTPARVEVCNAPTYAASTHCELQVTSAWSDTSITFTFNQGYLASGTSYVYAINAGGGVNASGHAISVP